MRGFNSLQYNPPNQHKPVNFWDTLNPWPKKEPKYKFWGFPDDLDNFTCGQWIEYFDEIKKKYPDSAKSKWLSEREREEDFFEFTRDCILDCDWVREMVKRGIREPSIIGGAKCKISDIIDAGTDTVVTIIDETGNVVESVSEGTQDTIEGLGSGLGGIGKILGNPIFWVVVAGIGVYVVYNFKDFNLKL
jgi:hypothetical protein